MADLQDHVFHPGAKLVILNEVSSVIDLSSCGDIFTYLQMERLVQARAYGPFNSFEDIRARVRGIGTKTLENMKTSTSPMFFLTKENFYAAYAETIRESQDFESSWEEPPICVDIGLESFVDVNGNYGVLFVGSESSGLTPAMKQSLDFLGKLTMEDGGMSSHATDDCELEPIVSSTLVTDFPNSGLLRLYHREFIPNSYFASYVGLDYSGRKRKVKILSKIHDCFKGWLYATGGFIGGAEGFDHVVTCKHVVERSSISLATLRNYYDIIVESLKNRIENLKKIAEEKGLEYVTEMLDLQWITDRAEVGALQDIVANLEAQKERSSLDRQGCAEFLLAQYPAHPYAHKFPIDYDRVKSVIIDIVSVVNPTSDWYVQSYQDKVNVLRKMMEQAEQNPSRKFQFETGSIVKPEDASFLWQYNGRATPAGVAGIPAISFDDVRVHPFKDVAVLRMNGTVKLKAPLQPQPIAEITDMEILNKEISYTGYVSKSYGMDILEKKLRPVLNGAELSSLPNMESQFSMESRKANAFSGVLDAEAMTVRLEMEAGPGLSGAQVAVQADEGRHSIGIVLGGVPGLGKDVAKVGDTEDCFTKVQLWTPEIMDWFNSEGVDVPCVYIPQPEEPQRGTKRKQSDSFSGNVPICDLFTYSERRTKRQKIDS